MFKGPQRMSLAGAVDVLLLSMYYLFSLIYSQNIIIVASEASDLIFKIVIFHDVPPRSLTLLWI